MKKGKSQPFDLFGLRPRRLYPSEYAEKGKMIILVPKQQNKLIDWIIPKKKIVNERVRLDILGSFIWNNCDGTKTVKDIADRMKQEYGKYAEPVDSKVSNYIEQLYFNKLIDMGKGKVKL